MQDRTINNALIALHKAGGHEGKLAEVLLDMRGVPLSYIGYGQRLKRGQAKGVILRLLATGPKTARAVSEGLLEVDPTIGQRSVYNRAYQALLRLEGRGLVVRDGKVWKLD